MRTTAGALFVLVSLGFSNSVANAENWTLSLRGGYGWPVSGSEPNREATYVAGVVSYPVVPAISVMGSVGYLRPLDYRPFGVCVGICATSTMKTRVVPMAIGFRLGGNEVHGVLRPALEFAPTLFYGHWTLEVVSDQPSRTSRTKLFAGFQSALVLPVRLSRHWQTEVSFVYLHSEAVEDYQISPIRQMSVLGSFGYRFGS